MRKQCPECKTVTGGQADYCGSCGYTYVAPRDRVRLLAVKRGPEYGAAVFAGFAIAVLEHILRH
jgi:hypothetical protein